MSYFILSLEEICQVGFNSPNLRVKELRFKEFKELA